MSTTTDTTTSAPPAPVADASHPPLCRCGVAAKLYTCYKKGPNENRPFWSCEKGVLRCGFFESADGKPWIRGRVGRDGMFRPFKYARLADPTLKIAYSTIPSTKIVALNRQGMMIVDAILGAPRKRGMLFRDTSNVSPVKITALRIYPNMKLERSDIHPENFNLKTKSLRVADIEAAVRAIKADAAAPIDPPPSAVPSSDPPAEMQQSNGGNSESETPADADGPAAPVKRKHSGSSYGYKYNLAKIERENEDYHISYSDHRVTELIEVVRKFIDDMATDPVKAIEKTSKMSGSCCLCGRDLTDKRSITRGCGPVCFKDFVMVEKTYGRMFGAGANQNADVK